MSTLRGELALHDDADAFARGAARAFTERAEACVARRGRFDVALTGGSSPGPVFLLLATDEFAARIPWSAVHFYWGDERAVPPAHPRSNYGLAHRLLLSRVPVPRDNVHRIRGELGAERAAREYEAEVRDTLGPGARLDLVHLGLGEDGHVLSLFPFEIATLTERERLVVPALNRALGEWRITCTVPVLAAAGHVELLVPGRGKARIARTAMLGALDPFRVPAHYARSAGRPPTWRLTRDAARELPPEIRQNGRR